MNDDKANRLREEALLNQAAGVRYSRKGCHLHEVIRAGLASGCDHFGRGVARRSSLSWRVDGHGNDVVATSRHGTRSNHAECNQLCHIINR